MTALDLMRVPEHEPFAVAIAESAWLFPFFETLHVLARQQGSTGHGAYPQRTASDLERICGRSDNLQESTTWQVILRREMR